MQDVNINDECGIGMGNEQSRRVYPTAAPAAPACWVAPVDSHANSPATIVALGIAHGQPRDGEAAARSRRRSERGDRFEPARWCLRPRRQSARSSSRMAAGSVDTTPAGLTKMTNSWDRDSPLRPVAGASPSAPPLGRIIYRDLALTSATGLGVCEITAPIPLGRLASLPGRQRGACATSLGDSR